MDFLDDRMRKHFLFFLWGGVEMVETQHPE